MSSTKYVCEITGKFFDQKSHIDKHLRSKNFKQQCRIKELELEKISKSDLRKLYGTSNIGKIIIKLKCVKKKINQYKLVKQNKDGSIYYQLDEIEKTNKESEKIFKNDFKKLKKWHNMLSGCGVTGDPAFDDIINILIICYLEQNISETGKYDFLNLDRYENDLYDEDDFSNFIEMLNIENLLKDTKLLTKTKDDNILSSFKKIGIVLTTHPLTKPMFPNEDFINCNKDNILSKLISEIYNYSKDKNIFNYQDLVGIAYEFWLNEYQGNSGKELGNYFTERDLMLMTFHLIEKEDIVKYINSNSVIGDEFCGTFGYPLYLKQYLKNNFDIKINDKNIYGVEIGERHSRLAMINSMFSLDNFSNIKRGDGFITNISEHLDLSVHNVPFGKRISYSNTKEHYENYRANNNDIPEFKSIIPVDVGKCDAPIASQMVIYKTKHIGLCIIKDGQETTGTGKFIKYRKYFCNSCNIKKILKIPGGIFSSTGTKTVCLYFVKGEKTKDIEFMELNDECDTITRIVKVSYKDLKHNNYSWDPNTYIIDEEFAKMVEKSNCEFKKLGDICEIDNGKRITKRNIDSSKRNIYNVYGGGFDTFKYDKYNREGLTCKISRFGASVSNFIMLINEKYWLNDSGSTITVKEGTNVKQMYLYYYLINNVNDNEHIFNTIYDGAGQQNIKFDKFLDLQIPIPTEEIQDEIINYLDNLNKIKDNENVQIKQINELMNSILEQCYL